LDHSLNNKTASSLHFCVNVMMSILHFTYIPYFPYSFICCSQQGWFCSSASEQSGNKRGYANNSYLCWLYFLWVFTQRWYSGIMWKLF
jgi:hypothetical protein